MDMRPNLRVGNQINTDWLFKSLHWSAWQVPWNRNLKCTQEAPGTNTPSACPRDTMSSLAQHALPPSCSASQSFWNMWEPLARDKQMLPKDSGFQNTDNLSGSHPWVHLEACSWIDAFSWCWRGEVSLSIDWAHREMWRWRCSSFI